MEKRLIDVNELIQSRPENLNEKYTTELIAAHHKGWNECNKAWLKIIEAQPTAYSIDEIVKQLEGLADKAEKDFKFHSEFNCAHAKHHTAIYNKAVSCYTEAIEIVQGGAE